MTFATLHGVISIVPQLGVACGAVLNTAAPGSGLKLMRLVSKQLSIAMMDVVQGYTLRLDAASDGLVKEMALLARLRARLFYLRVVVTENVGGGLRIDCSQPCCWYSSTQSKHILSLDKLTTHKLKPSGCMGQKYVLDL